MKNKNTALVVLLLAGALIVSVTGCKKETPVVPPAAEQTPSAVDQVSDAAKSVAADAKAGAEKTAAAVASVADQVDTIIAKAKALIDAGKLDDALNALNGLAGMTLSESQQKMVDGLKQQIQKAIAGKAAESGASAVGNLLGK